MTERRRALESAYRSARYRIHTGAGGTVLRIGEPAPRAAELLREYGAACAALITAHNPGSRRRSDAANRQAQRRFENRLAAAGQRWLPATNEDPEGRWPDEPGALILDLAPAAARRLAADFGQAALVWIDAGGTPALVWTALA